MSATPSNSGLRSDGPSWFHDEDVLLATLRRSRAAAAPPEIQGYESLRELKRGGQGVVYGATQRSTRRQVAIKVLLAGAYATPAQRRRFEREAELAASLRHPHVVRIYDSGVSKEGWPFLVMEYIEGQSLDAWAGLDGDPSLAGVGLRERVELLRKVVGAVAYAHQKGVIHRDLKPGNIRVDASGEPRVLDFGLAKASGGAGLDGTLGLSQTGQFLGSLPYASPEQADGDPSAVDVRSDVYSLGVVLCQVLTGRFPYEVSKSVSATLENIRNAEPSVVETPGLDADLRTVIVKCLAKEPERRYQSAGELEQDLGAWLVGEPIRARRDSGWYTLRKAAKRYRRAAWVGSAFALLLAAGAGLAIHLAQEASRERDAARQETARAEAVSDFLVSMVSAPRPDQGGRDVKVADLLDQAAKGVEEKFKGDWKTQATVRSNLGESYRTLGLYAEAIEQLTLARQILGEHGLGESEEALDATDELGSALHGQGEYAEALDLYHDLSERRRRVSGEDHPKTLLALQQYATCLARVGREEESEALARELVGRFERILGPAHESTIHQKNNYANRLMHRGAKAEAARVYEEAIAAAEAQELGGQPIDAHVTTLVNLASLYNQMGRSEEALALQKRAHEAWVVRYGPDHPETLFVAGNMGNTLITLKRDEEAERTIRSVIAAQRRVLGEAYPVLAGNYSNLATVLKRREDWKGAEEASSSAVEVATKAFGPAHTTTLVVRSNHADLLARVGRRDEALATLREIRGVSAQAHGPKHTNTLWLTQNIGTLLGRMSRFEEGERTLTEAYRGYEETLGPTSSEATGAAWELMKLYEAWDMPDLEKQWQDTYERDANDRRDKWETRRL